MPKTLIATLVAAAFVIVGCSAPTTTTDAEAQPAAETEEAGPTVEQFASIISESRRDVDEWLETWEDNGCSTIGISTGTDIFACEISLTTGGLVAETARLRLEAPTNPDAPVYIGDPPDSISIIWQSTEDAAAAASDAGEAIPDDCSIDDECAGKIMDFLMAMDDLQGKYDSWAPYM